MGSLSIWHWLIVLVIVLLLFGRGKIPDLMGDVAKGIKSFKKGLSDEPTPAEKDEAAAAAVPPKPLDHSAVAPHSTQAKDETKAG